MRVRLPTKLIFVMAAVALLPLGASATDASATQESPQELRAPVHSAESPRPIVRDEKDGIALLRPAEMIEGQLFVAELVLPDSCRSPSLTWQGRTHKPFMSGANHVALLPMPLGHVSPDEVLAVKCGRSTTRFTVPILAGTFPESVLSVDPKFSAPPPPSVKEENVAISKAFRSAQSGRFWREGFIKPTAGITTSPFGVRRTFNGRLKSRHRGIDYDGATGDEIVAANDGVIALVSDNYYYIGNSVFIDHGDNLFTVYFHLSSVDVKVGDKVKRGQRLGGIGKTGRVTGPHLHFAVKLANTYVNPDDLLRFEPGLRVSETQPDGAP